MNDIPFDAIGFDLDGTLVDSFRDLGAAVNHALAIGGFDLVPVDSSKDLIGGGAKIMLKRAVDRQGGMPDDKFHTLYKQMLAYYAEHNADLTRPYPGALQLLDQLDEAGIKVAVVTNKFEGFASQILTKLGLIDRFVTVIGGDSMGKGPDGKHLAKPAPDPIIEARKRCSDNPDNPARFVFVGDSTYDVNAAQAAGVPVVVAAYGYCDVPPQEMGGNAVIDSLSELISALKRL